MKREGGFGWSELIAGILLILLGVFTFARPESMLSGLVVVYGIIAIALGIEDIVVYVRLSRFTGFGPMLSLIAGILSVMCGIMLLANPNVGKWALTILMPIWFIAHCISGLTRVNLVRLIGNSFYYYFSLFLNILGLILGFMMLFSPMLSFLTIRAISYLVAVYLVLFGIESVIAAFARKKIGLVNERAFPADIDKKHRLQAICE